MHPLITLLHSLTPSLSLCVCVCVCAYVGPPYLPEVKGGTFCVDDTSGECQAAATCSSCTTFNQADVDHIKDMVRHSLTHSLTHSLSNFPLTCRTLTNSLSLTNLPPPLLTSLTHTLIYHHLTHHLTYSLTYSPTHPLTHSLTHVQGWNSIRLGVVWAGAQPEDADHLDPHFLTRLHAVLDLTDKNDLYVVLDNHGE